MRLTKEDKIQMYFDKLDGETRSSLSKKYGISEGNLGYILSLIDMQGIDLYSENKNRKYSKKFKEDAINRVLIGGESSRSVSLDLALSNQGTLPNWIRKYKENGYNVIEKKRGNSSMAKTQHKKVKKESELERLERENEYLKAEVAFLKKWNAVVLSEEKHKKKK